MPLITTVVQSCGVLNLPTGRLRKEESEWFGIVISATSVKNLWWSSLRNYIASDPQLRLALDEPLINDLTIQAVNPGFPDTLLAH